MSTSSQAPPRTDISVGQSSDRVSLQRSLGSVLNAHCFSFELCPLLQEGGIKRRTHGREIGPGITEI